MTSLFLSDMRFMDCHDVNVVYGRKQLHHYALSHAWSIQNQDGRPTQLDAGALPPLIRDSNKATNE